MDISDTTYKTLDAEKQQIDRATVREFLITIVSQVEAAGIKNGFVQMSRLHPASEKFVPTRYALDDCERMIEDAVANSDAGHNVYIEARTVSETLRSSERGKLEDTVAVFALVIDSDGDKGMGWTPPESAQPSLIVETSPRNFHYWFFLKNAVNAETGKQLGERIRKVVGCDDDTGTVTQPYRVAGTPNYPNKKKLARGRSPVPVPTRIVEFNVEAAWTPELIEEAFPLGNGKSKGSGGATSSSANGSGGGVTGDGAQADESQIPTDTMRVITGETQVEHRGNGLWNVMKVLVPMGFTRERIFALFERNPKGVASKYVGRLSQQVNTVYDKIKSREAEAKAAEEEEPEPEPIGEWDAGDDPGEIEPRPWLLGIQFCCGFISSVVAAGGVGKSALRLLQYISLATGRSLSGEHVFRRSRVLLISLEDDDNELQRRIQAVLNHFNIPRSELKGWLFCKHVRRSKIAELKKRNRTVGPLDWQIRDVIARRKPDLVALDPFVKLHSLEENNSGDMNFVCDLLTDIAVDEGIAVDLPHHVHKGTMMPGDADSGRGSSGIRDAGRLVSTLSVMSEKEAKEFDISFEERFEYVSLDPAKVNIAVRSGKAAWFHLAGEPLGNGTETYPNGDNVQVAEPWKPPETSVWKGLSYACLNKALDRIDAGVTDDKGLTGERYRAAPQATHAAWKAVQVIVGMEADKGDADCKAMIKAWIKSGTLVEKPYFDPVRREDVKGLFVDNSKRPGKTDTEERL